MPTTAEMPDTMTQSQNQAQTGQVPNPPSTAAPSSAAASSGPSQSMARRGPLSLFGLDNPFVMMRNLMDEMDRMFEGFGFGGPRRSLAASPGPSAGLTGGSGQGFWLPQIEVSRRGNELVVCADVPGLRKEDIHIEVRDDQLILEGERRHEYEGDQQGLYRSERSYGRFFRAIPLPDGTDPSQAQASFKDGVLEVKLPLPQQPEPRTHRIEIR